MTLVELLELANKGYPDKDSPLSENYDPKTGAFIDGFSDPLAAFIVNELIDTYDEKLSDEEQLTEALRVLERAQSDLEGCVRALEAKRFELGKK